jgi:hypothetical protein
MKAAHDRDQQSGIDRDIEDVHFWLVALRMST